MSVEWKELARAGFRVTAADRWTMIVDYIPGPARLKIEAWGMWPSGVSPCGPDGDTTADPLPAVASELAAVSPPPSYPAGALLGKIGGSTAGRAEGKVFAIGRCCVIDLAENGGGPLFVAVNADAKTFPDERYTAHVIVSCARP